MAPDTVPPCAKHEISDQVFGAAVSLRRQTGGAASAKRKKAGAFGAPAFVVSPNLVISG
jgi:hypothetical protein